MSSTNIIKENLTDTVAVSEKIDTDVNAFWLEKWKTGETSWRRGEIHAPFVAAIYTFVASLHGNSCTDITLPVELNETTEGYPMSGEPQKTVVRRFLHNKRVLVPLCGNSKIVSFVLEMGASAVVGADISELAIKSIKENQFHDIVFETFTVKCENYHECCIVAEKEETNNINNNHNVMENVDNVQCGKAIRIHKGSTHQQQQIILFEGDFFELVHCSEFVKEQIDFVYDRGALIAVRPADRHKYMTVLAQVLTSNSTVLLIRPIRNVDDTRGPPFAINNTELASLYHDVMHQTYTITETAVLNSLRLQENDANALPYAVVSLQPSVPHNHGEQAENTSAIAEFVS